MLEDGVNEFGIRSVYKHLLPKPRQGGMDRE
jgi:hypothetical protein